MSICRVVIKLWNENKLLKMLIIELVFYSVKCSIIMFRIVNSKLNSLNLEYVEKKICFF